MNWAALIIQLSPLAVETVEYIVNLIKKEATGAPITAEDWLGLIELHASKTADQILANQTKNG